VPNLVGVLDHHDFEILRRSAALTHAVPGATLAVDIEGRRVLTVTHALATRDGGTACSPCGFRNAVAKAWRIHESGRRLALLGIDGRGRTEVTLDVGPGGDVLDGDLVVTRIADRVVGIVATTLSPLDVACALEVGGVDMCRLSSHHDEQLGTTLLHLTVPIEDEAESAMAIEVLGRARDLCSVAELLAGLSPAAVQ
jgi:hypothetical protein